MLINIKALAAYHEDYRRKFLDEAAKDGEFGELTLDPDREFSTNHFRPTAYSWRGNRR